MFGNALRQLLGLVEGAHAQGKGNLPVVNGQEGPWNPDFVKGNGGTIPMPKVNGQNGPWNLDFAALNTPGMTRPGADFNGIQPSTSLDETLQGSDPAIQGETNPGFIPLQNSGMGGPGYTSNIQPALTLAALLKRK
jgi:hypothetical protein